MFYNGDLQSGIGLAIQQKKQVVCFVRDESQLSRTWEEEFLPDESLVTVLHDKAVLLRLEAGSQEAGFLNAFCPIDQVPVLVLIDAGKLRERVVGKITKDEFIARIRKALAVEDSTTAGQTSSSLPVAAATLARSNALQTPQSAPSSMQSSTEESSHINKDKGKGKSPAAPESATTSSANSAELSYAAKQRLKQQEARQERDRILANIEADKMERRAREQERKAAAAAALAGDSAPTELSSAAAATSFSNQGSRVRRSESTLCRLQVRFFDGTSLRTTLPATATLGKDVREWIDKGDQQDQRGTRHPPYTFKNHDPPLPARTLEVADEGKTLEELGLLPSATLVLIPVQNYTSAFGQHMFGAGGANGIFGMLFGLVNGITLMLTRAVGTLSGLLASRQRSDGAHEMEASGERDRDERAAGSSSGKEAGVGSAGIKVRTFADQRDEERKKNVGQEWYNGNQVNLQPNKKDEDEEEKE